MYASVGELAVSIAAPQNDVYVSAASAWEIAIKAGLGNVQARLEGLTLVTADPRICRYDVPVLST